VSLALQFGGASAGSRSLTLAPGTEQEALFEHRTRAAGLLEARLLTRDGFPADDRAVLELPEEKTLSVAVYSDEPELLRPMLEANPHVHAVFRKTTEYSAKPDAGLVILDRFHPPAPPAVDSIWIEPPPNGSPIPIRKTVTHVKLTRWHTENLLGEGLRSKDVTLDSVVIGFQPARSAMRYELTTPLLFANTLRWIAPDIFRRRELIGSSVGTVTATLDAGVKPSEIRVVQEDGRALPFTLRNRTLHFFAGAPGIVRVTAADRELVYSLVLPEISESKWEPPASVKRGIPAARASSASAVDLWQALAILGAIGLLVDWVYYGRLGRTAAPRTATQTVAMLPRGFRFRRKLSLAGRGRS
jgi:hypothetical protein